VLPAPSTRPTTTRQWPGRDKTEQPPPINKPASTSGFVNINGSIPAIPTKRRKGQRRQAAEAMKSFAVATEIIVPNGI